MRASLLSLLLLSLLSLSYAFTTTKEITTNAGQPIDNIRDSLTVGPHGPTLLQDAWTIEGLQVQNRERIPERVVHAQGYAARGNFVVTNSQKHLTIADFLQEKGQKTPVRSRISTVTNSKASPEFLRDLRGFAVKFYTQQGNYDLVGLDTPVFFLRDGRRFPQMVRVLKPSPVSGFIEFWRYYDYFAFFPESVHCFSFYLDDAGIPASFRQMNGYGVHTFTWVNEKGNATWVRYQWLSNQGTAFLQDAEALLQPYNFASIDLHDAILNGTFPSWTLYIQALDPATAEDTLGFDPLDPTKLWPIEIAPLQEVGVFTLDENVNDQFLETEQIAFAPSRLVPGIEPSNDRLLQSRLYAYPDAQRYRLGVNNQLLPVNRPICPFMNGHYDGDMNFSPIDTANPFNYFPSTLSGDFLAPAYPHDPVVVEAGQKVREDIDGQDEFSQAANRYASFDSARQTRFALRIASSLATPHVTENIKNIWLGFWEQVSPKLKKDIVTILSQLEAEPGSPAAQREDGIDVHEFRRAFLQAVGHRTQF